MRHNVHDDGLRKASFNILAITREGSQQNPNDFVLTSPVLFIWIAFSDPRRKTQTTNQPIKSLTHPHQVQGGHSAPVIVRGVSSPLPEEPPGGVTDALWLVPEVRTELPGSTEHAHSQRGQPEEGRRIPSFRVFLCDILNNNWPNEESVCLPFWEIRESEPRRFERWLSQTIDFISYSCRFLGRHSLLLGLGKDWLAQCQDNVTEWDIRSWCSWPDFPVGKHYKVTTVISWYSS